MLKRFFIVTAVAVTAAIVAAGQARATDYKVFLGEQVPCGFAKIPGCPAGIPRARRSTQFLPGNGRDQRRRHGHLLERELPHGELRAQAAAAASCPTRRRASTRASNDAAGTPFYFVGLAKFIYNGQAFGPYGPKTISGSTRDLERRALAGRPEGEARDVHLHVSEGRDVQPVLQHPPGHEGRRSSSSRPVLRCRRRRRRCIAAGARGADGFVGAGEGGGRRREAADEHRLHGRRQRTRRCSATSRRP